MKIFSSIGEKIWQFEQSERNGKHQIYEKRTKVEYTFKSLGNNRYVFILNGQSHLIHIIKENGVYHIHLNGDYFSVLVEDEQTRELRALVELSTQTGGGQKICAPIPGLITKIKVNEGDLVKEKDSLIILEAMKMENEIKSDSPGTVKRILVNEGMPVEKDQELIIIE
jgi:acetyl/propionyl-CoA carboxylase alpha subunit